MLWTDEILRLLQPDDCLDSVFIGCYASDEIPKERPYPNVLISNCSPSQETGSHWVAIYEPNKNQSYLFDSYGRNAVGISEEFSQFLKLARYQNMKHNSALLQNPLSTSCGYFASFFVIGISHELKPDEVVSFFKEGDVEFNEILVSTFVKDYMNLIKNENIEKYKYSSYLHFPRVCISQQLSTSKSANDSEFEQYLREKLIIRRALKS